MRAGLSGLQTARYVIVPQAVRICLPALGNNLVCGQTETARSTGLTGMQTMRHVIVAQALRRMIPPFVGLCTIMVKDTSLAAIIGVFELTRAAQESIERTLHPFELYLTAAAIYFGPCFPLSALAARAERRLQPP